MRSLFACYAVLLTTVLVAAPATQAEEKRCPEFEAIPVDQRFIGEFNGTAENTTVGGKGKMSINIERSAKKGEVRVLTRASEGLVGEGELLGAISADGKLCATDVLKHCTLLGGCTTWKCNLYGTISGNNLTGNYELAAGSGPGTIIGGTFEGRPPPADQEGTFDLQKFVPAYTPR